MSQFQVVPCPHCGAGYQLTGDYLAQYGGQQSQCQQCGKPFPIPRLGETVIGAVAPAYPPPVPRASPVQVLPYMGPDYRDTSTGIWRDGTRIVALDGAVFPARCVKCNAPADGLPLRRKLYWHHPLIFLTILAGILIYAIVALCVRKSGTVTVCLCRQHRVRRYWFIFGAWLSLPVAIAMFIVAGNTNLPELWVPLGIFTIIVGPVVGVIGSRILAPTRIDERYLWLKGAGAEFVATLSAIQ